MRVPRKERSIWRKLAMALASLSLVMFAAGICRGDPGLTLAAMAIRPDMIFLTSDGDADALGRRDGFVDTYEDVDPITNIHLEIVGSPESIFFPYNQLKDAVGFPDGHLDKNAALAIQSRFNSPGKIILGGGDGSNLDGDADEYNDIMLWYSRHATVLNSLGQVFGFPRPRYAFDYPGQTSPQVVAFKVGIDFSGGGRHLLVDPTLPLPHVTCMKNPPTSCPRPCPSACGECEDNVVNPSPPPPFIDVHCHDFTKEDHLCYSGKEIAQSFLGQRISLRTIRPLDNSDLNYSIAFKDRTPPRIFEIGREGILPPTGTFPDLGGPPDPVTKVCPPYTATTGDFYAPMAMTASDNTGGRIYSRFAIGRVNWPTLIPNWEFVGTIAVTLPGEPLASHVFLPNECLGEMKYSIFAWDANRVLNPGEPLIEEDKPEISYGLRPHRDLGKNPADAQGFPFMVDDVTNPTLDINSRIPEGEGKIWIDDNDRPNLIIKVQSMRNSREVMFFPPVGVASLVTLDPAEYNTFIENAEMLVEHMPSGSSHDFRILAIELSGPGPRVISAQEESWAWKFFDGPSPPGLPPKDPDFAIRHFRLENYAKSDTDLRGEPILAEEATFGERNGYGFRAVVGHKIPVVEDVEYEITIWAEDNIRYINWPLSGKQIDPPYSGIETGEIVIDIPNQVPPVKIQRSWRKDQFKSEPIRVVFREPTTGEPEMTNPPKFPSITATVFDYRGNGRSLTVLLKVSDEKTRVRVLEQKHRKN